MTTAGRGLDVGVTAGLVSSFITNLSEDEVKSLGRVSFAFGPTRHLFFCEMTGK